MNDDILLAELGAICTPQNATIRRIDRLAYSRDASGYSIIPRAVVRPDSINQICTLFKWSAERQIPLTFRAAGTSLSGQSVGEGIIVEISRKWEYFKILDNGKRVKTQPGIIAGRLNIHLKPYSHKLGPDPASINACSIGGILANNSSGMCCGVIENSYHTVESLSFLLPDGTYIDSALHNANERLQQDNSVLYDGILKLKEEVCNNNRICEIIRHKYKIKNTIGYSLNAFLDCEKPVEILTKLMIGSEGTLGFIEEAVFRTIGDKPHKLTGILYFPDVASACRAIIPLRNSGAAALELMDRAALRSVEHLPDAPQILHSLPENATALLVEFQAKSNEELNILENKGIATLTSLELLAMPYFTRNAKEQIVLWKIRKGMLPSIGATRNSGTGLINEDVAFPIDKLADAVVDLQQIFRHFDYKQAIIFGHAKDGNLHFILTQKFEFDEDIARYDSLMQAVAELVIEKYGGSFKAEHGTGRNAAPFVEKEWGNVLYDIMRRLKKLIDPHNILNPGVILNDDPQAHIKYIKLFPEIEESVDKCIECGFCESYCPSKDLTLTPRHRIGIRREIIAAKANGDNSLAEELERDYCYDGLDSCAVDGMCAVACPVGIDTGELVKTLRKQQNSPVAKITAKFLARNFGLAQYAVRLSLRIGHNIEKITGADRIIAFSKTLKKLNKSFPEWNRSLTKPPKKIHSNITIKEANAVYFPACIGRALGKHESGDLQDIFLTLCERANIKIFLPEQAYSLCCGLPFSSKGFNEARNIAEQNIVNAVEQWTYGGRLPLIIDANSCSQTLKNVISLSKYRILDAVEFAANELLPKLQPRKLPQTAAIHPTCSAIKTGIVSAFEIIATACADNIYIPVAVGCCGFAGDRGLLVPELAKSATAAEARELRNTNCTDGYSGNITCEIAMSDATGLNYRSILYLLEEATRPQS